METAKTLVIGGKYILGALCCMACVTLVIWGSIHGARQRR